MHRAIVAVLLLAGCASPTATKPTWIVGPGCTIAFNNAQSEIVQATVLHFAECPLVRMDSVRVSR
jgi:hypothetical protein